MEEKYIFKEKLEQGLIYYAPADIYDRPRFVSSEEPNTNCLVSARYYHSYDGSLDDLLERTPKIQNLIRLLTATEELEKKAIEAGYTDARASMVNVRSGIDYYASSHSSKNWARYALLLQEAFWRGSFNRENFWNLPSSEEIEKMIHDFFEEMKRELD